MKNAVPYFCLDCEHTHLNDEYNADEDHCPKCNSYNIVPDDVDQPEPTLVEDDENSGQGYDPVSGVAEDTMDWEGHFEGDMAINRGGGNQIEE